MPADETSRSSQNPDCGQNSPEDSTIARPIEDQRFELCTIFSIGTVFAGLAFYALCNDPTTPFFGQHLTFNDLRLTGLFAMLAIGLACMSVSTACLQRTAQAARIEQYDTNAARKLPNRQQREASGATILTVICTYASALFETIL